MKNNEKKTKTILIWMLLLIVSIAYVFCIYFYKNNFTNSMSYPYMIPITATIYMVLAIILSKVSNNSKKQIEMVSDIVFCISAVILGITAFNNQKEMFVLWNVLLIFFSLEITYIGPLLILYIIRRKQKKDLFILHKILWLPIYLFFDGVVESRKENTESGKKHYTIRKRWGKDIAGNSVFEIDEE